MREERKCVGVGATRSSAVCEVELTLSPDVSFSGSGSACLGPNLNAQLEIQQKTIQRIAPVVFQQGLYKYQPLAVLNIDEVAELHKRADIIYVDYFAKYTTPPPAFASLLSRLHYPVELATAEWVGFDVFRCGSTGRLVAMPRLRANGRFSPAYRYNSVKSSVSRLATDLQILEQAGICDYLIAMELTYPEEISKMLKCRELFDRVLKLAEKCLRVFVKKLEKRFYKGDKLSVYYNTHIWATHSPHQPHLHHHLNFPNALKNKQGELVRFQPYFRDLATLRMLWREAIFEVFGQVAPIQNVVINVHYIPLKNRPRLIHRLKYCSRRPTSDFFEHYAEDVCPAENLPFVQRVLCYSNPRRHLGWRIGSFKQLKEMRACMVNVCRCPLCHSPAEKVEGADLRGFVLVFWVGVGWCKLEPPPPKGDEK